MNVLAVQFDIAWENKQANFATVTRLLNSAAPEQGTLAILPEMFATGFSMNTEAIAEPYGGETESFLAETARSLQLWVLGGAAICCRDGKVRNKALLFSPEGQLHGFYAKMRPFSPGEEHRHYERGTQPKVFRCGDTTLSPFICYDLRFPELFRAAAVQRPHLFVVIANWPAKRASHWMRLLQARAIENQAYVVGVNRVGSDPYLSYGGQSVILDAQGDPLACAGDGEQTLRASLDLAALDQYRKRLPFLEDLRPL